MIWINNQEMLMDKLGTGRMSNCVWCNKTTTGEGRNKEVKVS